MKRLLQLLTVGVLLTLSGCYTQLVYVDDPVPTPAPYLNIHGGYFYDAYYPYWYLPYLRPSHRVTVHIPIMVRPAPSHQKQVQEHRQPDPPKKETPPASNRKSGATRSK